MLRLESGPDSPIYNYWSLNFPATTVPYKLPKFTQFIISKFKKLTSKVNVNKYLSDPNYFQCNFSHSPYVDKGHVHILAEDLLLL